MSLFTKLVVTAFTSAVLLVGGIFAGENLNQPAASTQSFGSFAPVQGQTYTLQGAGVTATQTTIPLSSFTTPDGRVITMAMFGGTIGYGTLEPNTNSKIEDITFSGVTQNANGSATLTGVTRGNDFVTPYAPSVSLAKAHAGGSYFILSNTAGFYGQQFLFANTLGTSTGGLIFSSTTPPKYDADPIWLNFGTSILADVAYVNSVVAAGAANASTIVKGIIQIATAVQTAAGTATGSTGALLVPPNSLFNATQSATTIIPVTNTSGKLSQAFLDLTQAFTWSGLHTFTVGLLSTASSTFSATTSIQASNVLNNAIIFNKIPYAFPATQGVLNTFLTDNGSGILSWAVATPAKYSLTSANAVTASGGTNPNLATSSILGIPAGVLTASSTWAVNANVTCTTSTTNCKIFLRDSGGTTIATCDTGQTTVSGASGPMTMVGANQSSLSVQSTLENSTILSGSTDLNCGNVSTSAFNTANALNLVLVASSAAGESTSIGQYSIVVNP